MIYTLLPVHLDVKPQCLRLDDTVTQDSIRQKEIHPDVAHAFNDSNGPKHRQAPRGTVGVVWTCLDATVQMEYGRYVSKSDTWIFHLEHATYRGSSIQLLVLKHMFHMFLCFQRRHLPYSKLVLFSSNVALSRTGYTMLLYTVYCIPKLLVLYMNQILQPMFRQSHVQIFVRRPAPIYPRQVQLTFLRPALALGTGPALGSQVFSRLPIHQFLNVFKGPESEGSMDLLSMMISKIMFLVCTSPSMIVGFHGDSYIIYTYYYGLTVPKT